MPKGNLQEIKTSSLVASSAAALVGERFIGPHNIPTFLCLKSALAFAFKVKFTYLLFILFCVTAPRKLFSAEWLETSIVLSIQTLTGSKSRLPFEAYSLISIIRSSALSPGSGYQGGFLDVAAARIADLPLSLGFVAAYNGLPALAMFLMGLALGRDGAFPPNEATSRRNRGYYWIAVISGATVSGIAMLVPLSAPLAVSAISFAVQAASAPVLSFGLVGLGLSLLQRHKNTRIVGFLAKSGGSSLSGYILHSILLGAVFYGWGLGQYGSLGAAAVMAIATATFLTIVLTLNVWRRCFRYGPDEWLLRSFVDLQWKPLRNDQRVGIVASGQICIQTSNGPLIYSAVMSLTSYRAAPPRVIL
eukprot:gene26464-34642_t